MMDRDDGIDDEVAALVRTAVAVGALMAEQVARHLEAQAREAEAASAQRRAEYEARIAAERSTARAQLAPVLRDDWWTRATPERIGGVYETAAAWSQHDDIAGQAMARIRDEVQRRYGVDIDAVASDVFTVRTERELAAAKTVDQLTPDERRLSYLDAQRWLSQHEPQLAERFSVTVLNASTEAESVAAQNDAIEEHRRRRRGHDNTAETVEAVAASVSLDAEAEETRRATEREAAARAQHHEDQIHAVLGQPRVALHDSIVKELQAQVLDNAQAAVGQVERDLRMAHWYDVADRRRALAADLAAAGHDPDSIDARMLVDASNAQPPEAAVQAGHHPRARRTRTAPDTSRGQDSGR